jgi:ArsR family transcriptional regulator
MKDITENQNIALMFKALGDPTRLKIFQLLRSCEGDVAIESTGDIRKLCGRTVGDICCQITGLDSMNSTISFHLKELRIAGLIIMEKQGKNVICRVNPEAVNILSDFLAEPLTAMVSK